MYKHPGRPAARPLVLTERGELVREALTGLAALAALASLFILLDLLIGA